MPLTWQKATILIKYESPSLLNPDGLYCRAKEGSLVEASMKRHYLAAAFGQGNSRQSVWGNLPGVDQQMSNCFHIHLALRAIIQAMTEPPGASLFIGAVLFLAATFF